LDGGRRLDRVVLRSAEAHVSEAAAPRKSFAQKLRENPASLVGVLATFAGIAWQVSTEKNDVSSPGSYLLLSLGFAAMAVGNIVESRRRRRASDTLHAAGTMFVAGVTAGGLWSKFDPPPWLSVVGAAELAIAFVALMPYAFWRVANEQDERERKIVLSAMSISFAVVIILMGGSVVLSQYVSAARIDTSWVLATGAGAWLISRLTLQRRM
jgi:hypothetical protein